MEKYIFHWLSVGIYKTLAIMVETPPLQMGKKIIGVLLLALPSGLTTMQTPSDRKSIQPWRKELLATSGGTFVENTCPMMLSQALK